MKSFLLLIAVNLALVPAQDISDSGEIEYASHGEHCDSVIKCHPGKNLDCLEGTCECQGKLAYDKHSEGCEIPPTPDNGFQCSKDTMCQFLSSFGNHSRCSPRSKVCECYSTHEHIVQISNTCYVDKKIGDNCVTHSDCNATIKGEAECAAPALRHEDLTCQCASGFYNVSRQECLPKQPFDSICSSDSQCQGSSLGHLSRCSQKTQKCECWDMDGNGKSEAKQLKGKCYFVRRRDELCAYKEECELGFHPNSDCMLHPAYNDQRVCQCIPGQKCDQNAAASGLQTFSFVSGILILLKFV